MHALRLVGLLLVFTCITGAAPVRLEPGSLEAALEQAREEGKCLYVAFLGEGWSLTSKRFKEEVLETPAFGEFAGQALVYFPIEARRKPPLGKEEAAVLQSWVIHFDVMTYPTLILLAPDGQEILRHGFKEIPPSDYVQLIKTVMPKPAG